jgi:hypothetical protein
MGRSRAEPPPPEPPSRTAADWGSPRGRAEPAPEQPSRQAAAERNGRGRAELPPEPLRQAAGADRSGNGAQRGRIDTPPERPAAPDWTAPSRDGFDASPPGVPAAQETAKADSERGGGGAGGGWLSNLLTRASREGEEASHGDDRGAAKSARAAVDALSVDIARMIDHEAAADLWERHNRGEHGVNVRRLYTAQGRKAFEEMRKRYKIDREFHLAVDRYIGHFDQLLGDVGRGDGGPMLARNYITSEAGKVYTMLAHAAGRFD